MSRSGSPFPAPHTVDRTRLSRLRWHRPHVMQLEDRIAPAVYGNLGAIEHTVLDSSLMAGDALLVEIASAVSFDQFTLSDGQLAGNLKLSFLNDYTPALGDSFEVLTSSQPLTGDFDGYEGLGFYDDLYLKPVINGNTLSLEVARLPGGKLTTTTLEIISAFAGGEVALSVVSPGVFGVTMSNASASAELEISEDELVIKSASITVDQTFTIGSFFEVESPSVTIEDFTISASGVESGTFSIGAASATLFPGKAFSATVEDFEFSYDTLTSAFEISVGSFELTVGEALVVTADSAAFTYDPDTIDVPGTEIGTIESLSISIPKLSGFTGTIEDLVIRNNGFAFANATVAVAGTFSIGSIAEVTDPSLTISDVDVDFDEPAPFSGSITLAVGNFTLFPGNTKFTATADELSATFDFSDDNNGAMTLEAASVVITVGSVVEFTIDDLEIDTSAEGDEPLVTVGSCGVNLLSLGISGSGLADGSFVILDNFGVSLSLNNDAAGKLKFPSWLPINITFISLQWPDCNADPGDFTVTFSATLSTAAIGGSTLTVEGGVTNVVVDVGKLLDGKFPIISMDDGLISVSGMLFGFEVTGTIIFGVVRVDDNGDLISPDRFVLAENPETGDLEPTDEASTADAAGDEIFFFGGLQVEIEVAGKGFDIKIGVSELGPLEMFISVSAPLILEPVSGLAISNLRGGISFGNPIESITDPEELADAEFETPADLTALQWAAQLKRQVAAQVDSGVTWEDFDEAFANPETIRISAGASLASAYATNTTFHADVDITADLSGKFIFNAAGKLANDTIDLNFRAYLDLANVAAGDATILFLTDINGPDSPLTVYGGVVFSYLDGLGNEIDNPDENSNSQHIQLTISGGARFQALTYFEATLSGSVTFDFDIQSTVLTVDMTGDLEASYLGNLAQAAGHFTLDFKGLSDVPVLYGAMVVRSGEAFDILTDLGFEVTARGFFYINTDTEGHEVELTFSDDTTEVFDLKPLSVGFGVYGSLSWSLAGVQYLTIVGLMDWRVTAADGAMIFVNASLNLGPEGAEILTMLAQGFLTVNAGGVAGMIELTREQSATDFLGLGIGTAFSQSSTFVLVFNTTEVDQVFELPEGVTLPNLPEGTTEVVIPGGPPPEGTPATATTWEETETGFYFVLHASGALEFLDGNLAVSGEFNLLLTEEIIDISVDAKVAVFGSEMAVTGVATIEDGNFFCELTATASIYPSDSFEIGGTFILHIDTAEGEYFIDIPDAKVNVFGLKMNGSARIAIDTSSGAFSFSGDLSLDFFGIATFDVHASIDSSGSFDFSVSASFSYTFGYDVFTIGLHGGMSLRFANEGFFGSFNAGADVSGEQLFDITGSVAITTSYVYLSFSLPSRSFRRSIPSSARSRPGDQRSASMWPSAA